MRKLRVSTSILRSVVGDKRAIDALAFAIIIKQTYVNSLVVNPTISSMKAKFGMGSDKLRKVVADGIEFGFLRREGNALIANRLHGNRNLTYTFKRWFFIEASRKKDRLTISGVRSMIEEAIIVNHVRIQNQVADTHDRASNPEFLVDFRRARRKESRMLQKPYSDGYSGLSNKRIQSLIGRSHSKASKIVKNALSHRLVSRQFRASGIDMHGDPCNFVTKSALEDMNIIVSVRLRCAFMRFSNEYKYMGKVISKANNGRVFF